MLPIVDPFDNERVGKYIAGHLERNLVSADIAGCLGFVPLKIVILHNIRAARKRQEHTYNYRQPSGVRTTKASLVFAGMARLPHGDAKIRPSFR
jgi:hypothetical protein